MIQQDDSFYIVEMNDSLFHSYTYYFMILLLLSLTYHNSLESVDSEMNRLLKEKVAKRVKHKQHHNNVIVERSWGIDKENVEVPQTQKPKHYTIVNYQLVKLQLDPINAYDHYSNI